MKQPINDGGPAFPAPAGLSHITSEGMTLRDDLVMAAFWGFCASIRHDQVWSHDEMVTTCYQLADAMLKAREVKL